MPIYEYRCHQCNKEFEVWQKITEEAVHTCPHCNGSNVQRLISSTSFQLKGTGWYITDYARAKSGNGKGGSNGKQKDSGDKGSASSTASSDITKSAAATA